MDECQGARPPCRGLAQCVNLPGAFECRCPAGYRLTAALDECEDVDECADRRLCEHGECRNTIGSYRYEAGDVASFPPPRRESALDVVCARAQVRVRARLHAARKRLPRRGRVRAPAPVVPQRHLREPARLLRLPLRRGLQARRQQRLHR